MSTETGNGQNIDWEEILLELTAFTLSWARGKAWFRGKGTTSFLMGKEVNDYVYEAIGRYLEHPGKFNPAKGRLIDYLQYQLVRSLISNDVRKSENKLTDNVFAVDGHDGDDEANSNYAESILPYTAALFPDNIDYAAISQFIEKGIAGDKEVENIFLGLYTYGLKRGEVIKEFNMQPADYDNAMRRLTTIMNGAAVNFKTKSEAV